MFFYSVYSLDERDSIFFCFIYFAAWVLTDNQMSDIFGNIRTKLRSQSHELLSKLMTRYLKTSTHCKSHTCKRSATRFFISLIITKIYSCIMELI